MAGDDGKAVRAMWLLIGAAVAGIPGFIVGMATGQRDAQLLQMHDRNQAVAMCAIDNMLPVLIVRDVRSPKHDYWTCRGGPGSLSNRKD